MQLDILRKSYDRFADRYDEIFLPRQQPKIEGLAAVLPRPLPRPALDAGAGTGLAGRLLDHPFVALDASRGMLGYAAPPRVQADLARLPFADDRFALVLSVTALIDFTDPRPALSELARVLRPDGWLALSVLKIEDVAAVQYALEDLGLDVIERLDLEQDLGFVCRPTR